tara:strand:+ start:549 stop:1070 length:522 start_codon:yes stop_codon:yes gene_type:complete
MEKFNKYIKQIYLPILLILILSFSRLIPHPWNFTPILAAGIFSGFYFKNFILGSFIVICSMFLGDLYLGFHNTMFFTYASLVIAVVIGLFIKNFKFTEIVFSSVVSSVCFFIVTNFGAWLVLDMYEKNFAGLLNSYVLGIPFFQNTIISTLFYLFLIKILFELLFDKKKWLTS